MLFFTIKCYDLFHLSLLLYLNMKEKPQWNADIGKYFRLRSVISLLVVMKHVVQEDGERGELWFSDFPDAEGRRELAKKGVFLKGVSCTPSACHAFCNIKLCKVFVQILVLIYWSNSDYRVTSKCVLENCKNFCFMISETKYF